MEGYAVVLLILYFIPTVVAFGRGKRNAAAILALNLLLGWTFIGWIVAFTWSLTYEPPKAADPLDTAPPLPEKYRSWPF